MTRRSSSGKRRRLDKDNGDNPGYLPRFFEAAEESDCDIIIRHRLVRRIPSVNERAKPTQIINKTKSMELLNIVGADWPLISGHVLSAVFHYRFAEKIEQSWRLIVLKNLIVIFQGCILFEDCLVKEAYQTGVRIPPANRNLSILQVALGFSTRWKHDSTIVSTIIEQYKQSRIGHILKSMALGKEPDSPDNPTEALLVRLIDRYIVFDFLQQPLHTPDDGLSNAPRVEAHKRTAQHALTDKDTLKKLFTEFAAMLPEGVRGDGPTRPWDITEWVATQAKARAESETAAKAAPDSLSLKKQFELLDTEKDREDAFLAHTSLQYFCYKPMNPKDWADGGDDKQQGLIDERQPEEKLRVPETQNIDAKVEIKHEDKHEDGNGGKSFATKDTSEGQASVE